MTNPDPIREPGNVKQEETCADPFCPCGGLVHATPRTQPPQGEPDMRDPYVRGFVQGAKWWEFESTGATMWQSDQQKAFGKAVERVQDGLSDYDRSPARYEKASEPEGESK